MKNYVVSCQNGPTTGFQGPVRRIFLRTQKEKIVGAGKEFISLTN